MSAPADAGSTHWHRNRVLYLLVLVCIAPVIASYYAYYVAPPGGRTNYGELVQPQRPTGGLTLRRLDGTAFDMASLRGRWAMVLVDDGACGEACQRKLWKLRQVRLTAGKDRERIERIFLITDDAPLETLLLREYDGTLFLRAETAQLQGLLNVAEPSGLSAPMWLIDPLGNLMMQWPADADPNRMKRDVARLLRASRVG